MQKVSEKKPISLPGFLRGFDGAIGALVQPDDFIAIGRFVGAGNFGKAQSGLLAILADQETNVASLAIVSDPRGDVRNVFTIRIASVTFVAR